MKLGLPEKLGTLLLDIVDLQVPLGYIGPSGTFWIHRTFRKGFKNMVFFIHILWIRGGGSPDVDKREIIFCCKTLIKYLNVDKGRGGRVRRCG